MNIRSKQGWRITTTFKLTSTRIRVDECCKMSQPEPKLLSLLEWINRRYRNFGAKKPKDTVTAIVFIRKIEDLARTNHCTDTATYANVANAFKGFAREWLFATADMLDLDEFEAKVPETICDTNR